MEYIGLIILAWATYAGLRAIADAIRETKKEQP
jgi:hypothetical protein